MSNSQNVIAFRQRRKINLIKVAGDKCCLCNYNHCIGALEFHHIDPSQKSYGLAANGNCHDLEKDLAEIKKCILVCANCHREIHEGYYTQEELWLKQIYNEEIANELRQKKEAISTKTRFFCKQCGNEIAHNITGLCKVCILEARRVVKQRPSRAELKKLIRMYPFTEIGRMYNISDNAIRKWCISEKLPSTKKEINQYSNEDWENI